MSHQKAYREIVDRRLPFAVVLEDDATLSEQASSVVEAVVPELRPGDVVLLERRGDVTPLRFKRMSLPGGHTLVYLHRHAPWGAVAYIVTLEAAQRLLAFSNPVHTGPDDWKTFSSRVVVRAVTSPVAFHDESRPSEIGHDRFAPVLAPPRWPERVRFRIRNSPPWTSEAGFFLRGVALSVRISFMRLALRRRRHGSADTA